MRSKKNKFVWRLMFYTSWQRFDKNKTVIYPYYLNNINETLNNNNINYYI